MDLNKKQLAARLWCVLNANGDTVTTDLEKGEVMERAGIHARDLRILDPNLSYPSTILGRERAIVVNLEHIKAVITADEVLLRNPNHEHVIPIVEELRRRLPQEREEGMAEEPAVTLEKSDSKRFRRSQASPFEFRALEVALEAICSFLDARTTELEQGAYPALDELTSKVSNWNLDRVRKLKSGMTRLISRVQKVRDELEHLLDDDEDMAELYLTRKISSLKLLENVFPASPAVGSRVSALTRTNSSDSTDDVETVEMLLECYFMQADRTLNKLNSLREYIDDTEDYINIQLDNHRNQLIQLELVLNAGTLSLSLFALVGGIFGMNIPYTWNKGYGFMFKWVVVGGTILTFGVFSIILAYARYKHLFAS